jgi:hypothetical protein
VLRDRARRARREIPASRGAGRIDAGLLTVPAGSVAAFDAAAIASKIRECRPYGENAAAIELNGPLRYTGIRLISRGNRAEPTSPPVLRRLRARL